LQGQWTADPVLVVFPWGNDGCHVSGREFRSNDLAPADDSLGRQGFKLSLPNFVQYRHSGTHFDAVSNKTSD